MTRRAFAPRSAGPTCSAALLPTAFLAVIIALALSGQTAHARSTDRSLRPSTSHAPSSTAKATLPTVTIEARQAVERQVDHFVNAVVVQSEGQSLLRWNSPICPLVQGLPREFSKFVQVHLSRIARVARAPVAGKHCEANLYVFATYDPARLLKRLRAYRPRMYETRDGLGDVRRFVNSRRPIRVWYNTERDCHTRSSYIASMVNGCAGESAQLITTHESVRSILEAYIVVDMNRIGKITTRQLADYVAMIGLADVHFDAHASTVPTILRLFQNPARPPQELSAWDRALLYSLYNTSQTSITQVADMEETVTKRITLPPSAAHPSSRQSEAAIPPWANELVPQRDAKAIYWYHIAADRHNAAAQYGLGVRYALGQGVPQDYAKAAQWFHKAAEQGDADAQSSLGLAYAKGRGVPRNYTEAAQWFRKSARQGNADAQFFLGLLYAHGQGVLHDSVSAYKWWILAKADSSFGADVYQWSLNQMKMSASSMTAGQMARARREASGWLAAHRSAR